MKKSVILLSILIMCILQSCSPVYEIFFYNPGDIDDGEIWDSDLEYFFMRKERLSQVKSISHKLTVELEEILISLKGKTKSEVDEGDFYEYAFVFQNKDTIFTNSAFEVWRHKNIKAKIPNNVKGLIRAIHH